MDTRYTLINFHLPFTDTREPFQTHFLIRMKASETISEDLAKHLAVICNVGLLAEPGWGLSCYSFDLPIFLLYNVSIYNINGGTHSPPGTPQNLIERF